MNIDGSDRKKICSDNCYYLNVYGDYVYYSNYSDKHALYRINKDGSDKRELCRDDVSYINVTADWIFFAPN